MRSADALREVRRLAVAGRIILTGHAEQRMRQRSVSRAEVRLALSNARSCRAAENERWKVEGPDADGDDLTLVVAIEAGVVVVTVY